MTQPPKLAVKAKKIGDLGKNKQLHATVCSKVAFYTAK